MNWEVLYLVCFVSGLAFSCLALLTGGHHVHFGIHHGIHLTHNHGAGSVLNGFSLAAFLCWFGGAGYLLEKYGHFGFPLILIIACISGISAALVVFGFLARVLAPHDRPLTAADTEMTGVIGRVSGTIRPDGTGEILFSQNGARCSSAARSEYGLSLERGKEVVVMRYERGIAYVRPWDELSEGFCAETAGEEPGR